MFNGTFMKRGFVEREESDKLLQKLADLGVSVDHDECQLYNGAGLPGPRRLITERDFLNILLGAEFVISGIPGPQVTAWEGRERRSYRDTGTIAFSRGGNCSPPKLVMMVQRYWYYGSPLGSGKQPEPDFFAIGCEHEWQGRSGGRCITDYSCTKCKATYTCDSSD